MCGCAKERSLKMSAAIIETEGLTRSYGDICALKPLELRVPEGEWLSVMGHSGSGKSTLLNLLGGLDRPSNGSLRVGGEDLQMLTEDGLARFRREFVGIIFQQHHLVPYLTAVENVMLAQYFHSIPDEAEARLALERVGLGHRLRNRPGELSGGEQQRLLLARALAQEAPVLLLDEPTTHLDLQYQVIMLEEVRRLAHEAGLTVLAVLHDLNLVSRYADRVALMVEGSLRAVGDPVEVLNPQLLEEVYHLPLQVIQTTTSGRPVILPAVL